MGGGGGIRYKCGQNLDVSFFKGSDPTAFLKGPDPTRSFCKKLHITYQQNGHIMSKLNGPLLDMHPVFEQF